MISPRERMSGGQPSFCRDCRWPRAIGLAVALLAALVASSPHGKTPVASADDDEILLATPVVALTAPPANGVYTAPATIAFTATAKAPAVPVKRVDYYQGATQLGGATTAPFGFSWSGVSAGIYSLTARATSNLGISGASPAITVRVCDVPTVTLTAPASGAILATGSTVTLRAAAASPASACAISKVEFYRSNGGAPVLVGTAVGVAPYQVTWTATPAGPYMLTAKIFDERGVTATSTGVNVIVDVAPTVSITAPIAGTVFAPGSSIAIAATASDADGAVAKVEFYNGATLLGTSTTPPYGYTWAGVAKGNYSLTARAYDNVGATTTSAPVAVIVTQKPTVSITAPANNTVLAAPASTTITATASDPDGTIAKVEFYNGATLLCTVTATPYNCAWNNVAAGTYLLTAKAYDDQGATTTSPVVTVIVNQPPTVNITAPASGAMFVAPANITFNAIAADSDGTISKVEYYDGATLLGTSTTSPYSVTWSSVPAGSYTVLAKAYDNRGATASAQVSFAVCGPPSIALTSPIAGQTAPSPATFTLSANCQRRRGLRHGPEGGVLRGRRASQHRHRRTVLVHVEQCRHGRHPYGHGQGLRRAGPVG